MPALTRAQRPRLIEALGSITLFATLAGRNLLLADLPPDLIQGMARSDPPAVDLFNMIQAAETWGPLEDGTPALLLLIENALLQVQGSAAAATLQAIRAEIF